MQQYNTAYTLSALYQPTNNLFKYYILHSLRDDIRQSIEKEFKPTDSRSLDERVEVVLQCVAKRDYLTIHRLGDSGSSAADIHITILHALMKGI